MTGRSEDCGKTVLACTCARELCLTDSVLVGGSRRAGATAPTPPTWRPQVENTWEFETRSEPNITIVILVQLSDYNSPAASFIENTSKVGTRAGNDGEEVMFFSGSTQETIANCFSVSFSVVDNG